MKITRQASTVERGQSAFFVASGTLDSAVPDRS
jgi:hypothetical protein